MKTAFRKCPKCGMIYEFHTCSETSSLYWGTPFIRCDKCGNEYIDKNGREMAATYNSLDQARSALRMKKTPSKGSIIAIILGLLCASAIFFNDAPTGTRIFALILGLGIATAGFLQVRMESPGETDDYINKEYNDSKRRMSDAGYAAAYRDAIK